MKNRTGVKVVRIRDENHAFIKGIAEKEGRTVGAQMNRIVDQMREDAKANEHG